MPLVILFTWLGAHCLVFDLNHIVGNDVGANSESLVLSKLWLLCQLEDAAMIVEHALTLTTAQPFVSQFEEL